MKSNKRFVALCMNKPHKERREMAGRRGNKDVEEDVQACKSPLRAQSITVQTHGSSAQKR